MKRRHLGERSHRQWHRSFREFPKEVQPALASSRFNENVRVVRKRNAKIYGGRNRAAVIQSMRRILNLVSMASKHPVVIPYLTMSARFLNHVLVQTSATYGSIRTHMPAKLQRQ